MGILFVLQIQIGWAAFEWQSAPTWDFLASLVFLLLPVGAYLLSVLLVPDLDQPGEMDLRASYVQNRARFFGRLALPPRSVFSTRRSVRPSWRISICGFASASPFSPVRVF